MPITITTENVALHTSPLYKRFQNKKQAMCHDARWLLVIKHTTLFLFMTLHLDSSLGLVCLYIFVTKSIRHEI